MENSINEITILIIKFYEMIQMKKLLIIYILIISIVFISGCTSDEQASSETSASSQSNQESDTHSTGSILKSSDVSGLTLDYNKFYSVPKNTLYLSTGPLMGNDIHDGADEYTDTLRMGHRNVGEESHWIDQSGKDLFISFSKFDSNPDFPLIENFNWVKNFIKNSPAGEPDDFGDPNIGDYSFYAAKINPDTDVESAVVIFIHGNTYVFINVIDEEGISKKTAIRIAETIESRLD